MKGYHSGPRVTGLGRLGWVNNPGKDFKVSRIELFYHLCPIYHLTGCLFYCSTLSSQVLLIEIRLALYYTDAGRKMRVNSEKCWRKC